MGKTAYSKSRERLSTLLISVMLFLGCSAPVDDPQIAAPLSDRSSVTSGQVSAALFSGILDESFALTDGKYEGEGYVEGASSRPIVTIVPASVALHDFDHDGFDEATVVLAANTGGSGTYLYLAIVDVRDGIAQSIGAILLGDRFQLQRLLVEDERIIVNTLEHGDGDPMCCPTQAWRREWTLQQDTLHNAVSRKLTAAALARRYKGHIVWGHEMRSFTECGTQRTGWVFDIANLELETVMQQLAGEPYQPLFAEIVGIWDSAPHDGFAADFDESISVVELLRAEREGFACNEDLAGVVYRARGNEPSWRLDMRDDSVTFSSMNDGEVVFASPEITTMSDSVRIKASTANEEIQVTITAGRCVDAMSGSIFAFTATATIGERQFTGCAVDGL